MSYSQPPSYNAPPPYPPQIQPSETSTWSVISLIAGILGWLGLFGLGGIVAVISGHIAKGQIRDSYGRVTGGGMATAGLILGYANLALSLVGCCISILVFTGAIAAPTMCLPFLSGLEGLQ
jgi:hypothetical protein